MKTKKTKTVDGFINANPLLWGTDEQERHMDKVCGGTKSEVAQRVARDDARKLATGWALKVEAQLAATRDFERRIRKA
jgi:hypothetical protein